MPLFRFKSKTKEREAKTQFLINELAKTNEMMRQNALEAHEADSQQTLASFEYQWKNLPSGIALPTDPAFMQQVKTQICKMTGLPPEWFPGKKVIDVGCGIGRFTYGLLSLGAEVTSCDASTSALERTQKLCEPYKKHLRTFQTNLLKDKLPQGEFDLAFSFGVVHHTGNTYLAMKKVCSAAKAGGKVFLMVYGYPEKYEDFLETNSYEALRNELRHLNFDEKVSVLRSKFPEDQVHGWFDAVSPRINDLLKFGELVEVLNTMGVQNVKRTMDNRNWHVVGDKAL